MLETIWFIILSVSAILVACILANSIGARLTHKELDEVDLKNEDFKVDICDSCSRWGECNGVDKDDCTIYKSHNCEVETDD